MNNGGYSVYKDNVDVAKVKENSVRLQKIEKVVGDTKVPGGSYEYNDNGQVIKRDYADSTISYEYNDAGKLVKASGLMKIMETPSYVKHTDENFISVYEYMEDGNVLKETKSIFPNDTENLDGDPIQIYEIEYLYDSGKLYQKDTTPTLGGDDNAYFTRYDYNAAGQMYKVDICTDIDLENISQTIELEYNDNGDISKAIQTIGDTTKVFTMTYITDPEDAIYGVYYVDPIKEWKVKLDFFGLSFKPLESLTEVNGEKTKVFSYSYTYGDEEKSNFATTAQLSIDGYIVNYEMTYN